MKDAKKQKAKTYERRKNRIRNEYVRKEKIREQINSIEKEIELFKLTVVSRKIDLCGKISGSTLIAIVGSMFPLAILCPDCETLNELFNELLQKTQEKPLVITTPFISASVFVALLNLVLNRHGVASFSEIKSTLNHNKSLLNKKSELEAKLERKNYIDADKTRTKSKTKTYKK